MSDVDINLKVEEECYQLLDEIMDMKKQSTKHLNPLVKAKMAEQAVGKSVRLIYLLIKRVEKLESKVRHERN